MDASAANKIEILPDSLEATPQTLEELRSQFNDVRTAPPDRRIGILRAAHDTLANKRFTKEQRELINQNLRELRKTTVEKQATELVDDMLKVNTLDTKSNVSSAPESAKRALPATPEATSPSKPETAPTATPEAPTSPEQAISYWERLKHWTKEHNLDPRGWSREGKIAGAATLTLGIFGLIYWLRKRKKKTAEPEEGEEAGKKTAKKTPRWLRALIWVPILGAIGFGMFKLYENYEGVKKMLGDTKGTVEKTVATAAKVEKAAEKGMKSGWDATKESYENTMGKDGREIEQIRQRLNSDECRNNPALRDELLKVLWYKPAQFYILDGSLYMLHQGGKVLLGGWELGKAFMNVKNKGIDEVIQVYVNGICLYATSWAAVDFLWLAPDFGVKGAALQAGKRTIGWPYEIWRKGARQITGYLLPTAGGEIARTELKLGFSKGSYLLRRIQSMNFGTWEELHLSNLYREWNSYSEMMAKIGKMKGGEDAATAIANRMNWIERQFLKGFEQSKITPVWMEEILNLLGGKGQAYRNQIASKGGLKLESLRDILEKASLRDREAIAVAETQLKTPGAHTAARASVPESEPAHAGARSGHGSSGSSEISRRASSAASEAGEETMEHAAGIPKEWLTHRQYPALRVLRSRFTGEGTELFDTALERAARATAGDLGRTIELMGDLNVVKALSNTSPQIERAIQVVLRDAKDVKTIVPALQRVSAYISCLGERFSGKLLDEEIIATVAKVDMHPIALKNLMKNNGFVSSLTDVLKQPQGEKAAAQMIEHTATGARVAGRGLLALGAGVEIGMGVMDYLEYKNAKQRLEEQVQRMHSYFSNMEVFEKTAKGYRHKQSGLLIDIESVTDRIHALSNPALSRVLIDGFSATSTALMAGFAPTLAFGPAGIVLMGTVLVVHGVNGIREDTLNRQFILDMPTPVLEMLGMEGTVGESSFGMAKKASTWMWSDISQSGNNEMEKRLLRKKAFLCMFAQELRSMAQTRPDAYREIMGGKDIFGLLDEGGEFFRNDFEQVIKPFLAARLFQLSSGNARWSEFRDLKIDDGFLFGSENVSPENLQKALHEALWFYTQDIREKRYRAAVAERASLPSATPGEAAIANTVDLDQWAAMELQRNNLQKRIADTEGQSVFGVQAKDLPKTGPETPSTAEKMLLGATNRLDAAAKPQMMNVGMNEFASVAMVEPVRRNMESNAFLVDLPQNVLPAEKNRQLPLWQIGTSAPESKTGTPAERYNRFMQIGRAIEDRRWRTLITEPGNKTRYETRSGDVPVSDHKIVEDYYRLLCQYPEFDEGGTMRSLLSTKLGAGIGIWRPGGSAFGERNRLLNAIDTHLQSLEQKFNAFNPVAREKQANIQASPNQRMLLTLPGLRTWKNDTQYLHAPEYRTPDSDDNVSAIHVVFRGNDQILKANTPVPHGSDVAVTPFIIPGLGAFHCEARLGTEGRPTFKWTFIGSSTEKCYVYRTNEQSIEQPGLWINLEKQEEEAYTWNIFDNDTYRFPALQVQATVQLKDGTTMNGEANELKKYLSVEKQGGATLLSVLPESSRDIDTITLVSPLVKKRVILKVETKI